MGKAARLKAQRRTGPPPVAKKGQRPDSKVVWIATAGIVGVVVVVVAILLATRSSPKVAAQAPITAADKNAPAELVKAANSVNFHPTTEPGVGEIESQPASAAGAAQNGNLLAAGTTAPNFTLKTPQGQSVSLSDYRGKAVLLEFFASWCPHCNAEAPHLRTLAKSLQGKKIAFLSVNADGETAPSVFAFHRYYGLPYPALVDPSSQPGSFNQPGAAGPVTNKYKVASFPTFYVISPTGKVTWASDGEQPDALLRQQVLAAAKA
ncbi:MAG TPA: TlpA disulfide reductase family protein [Gaiellaceae bacterium]|nr:TlpA disulfide reductase family protein [Gaiellaceae bacterium]